MEKIVVLGGGESGYGSAILAKNKGFEVFLSDRGSLGERYKNALDKVGVAYEEGAHSMERILSADLIIKSPGIPESAEVMKNIRAKGIKTISEIEFAGSYSNARKICITGSNGKTTTATLTYKILKDAGLNVVLAGNIGVSFAYNVATENPDIYVLELSSFQLDGCYDFHANTAILTNITPDHLDRYDYKMSNYVESKFRIAQNQTNLDNFIFSSKDPETTTYMNEHSFEPNLIPISTSSQDVTQGGFIASDGVYIVCRYDSREVRIDTRRLLISGLHNYANIMDSVLAAMIEGVSEGSIIRSVESFGGIEHRMERVGEINGVLYINDSKATNVDSTWYALESLKTPTIWIAGGTDKGNDYSPLYDFARRNVKTLICMGVDNSKLLKSFEGIIPTIYDTHSIDEAFDIAIKDSNGGDTVLLSPCCASFDLFKNYEDRGNQFKMKVEEFKKLIE